MTGLKALEEVATRLSIPLWVIFLSGGRSRDSPAYINKYLQHLNEEVSITPL